MKAKHAPIISMDLFDSTEKARAKRRALPQGIRSDAHVYSLSGIAKCGVCGNRLRVVTPTRMLCKHRLDIGGCQQPSAILPVLETQMAAYLQAFKLPKNYKDQMLAYCKETEYDTEKDAQITAIKARLSRIKELYSWGDMGKAEYLSERQELQAQLAKLNVKQFNTDHLSRVAEFLNNLELAWGAADQEQRNKLATELFDGVWVKEGLIQGVTPKPEMVPFFDVVYSKAAETVGRCDFEARRGRICNLLLTDSEYTRSKKGIISSLGVTLSTRLSFTHTASNSSATRLFLYSWSAASHAEPMLFLEIGPSFPDGLVWIG